ncbi:MAG: hypothetical protein RBT34_05260 [Anaerolineaceae bacterium]|jgi:hypothetical protein|nr:hypothetical protein [Anaerolineaceae bacterium]
MQEQQSFPDANRLSVLLAIILFVYALIPFVNVPPQAITINLFRIQFNFNFNIHTLVSVLVAALAAVGAEWLVRSHPNLREGDPTFHHWMLPAFSAWVIDVPLSTIAIGPEWWIIFGFGGLFLLMIFVSEYITIDQSDAYHVPARVALSAVSYAFFLVLAITVRAANMRLYLLVPAMVLSAALVGLRTLNLRLSGQWAIGWSIAAALIVSQLTIGLHYLRLSPLSFGLILLGVLYAITGIAAAVVEERPIRTAWIEPAAMMTTFLVLAVVFRF